MSTLMLFDLAPGFLVNHSARMARELEAAASDFATAVKTLGANTPVSPDTQAAMAPPSDGTGVGTASVMDGDLPPAYLEILSGGGSKRGLAHQPTAMKPEDAETAAGFASVARHLRFVIDLAEEDAKRSTAQDLTARSARKSTSGVIDAMARLQGPSTVSSLYW
jgi:hypothetical protein